MEMDYDEALAMLDWLRHRQHAERLTDQQLADELGISRPMWNQIKRGRVLVGRRTIVKVLSAFPHRPWCR